MILIAIGGAEDKAGDMTVLKRVLAEAKGAQSRVHVITTATAYPEKTKQAYEEAFAKLNIVPTVTHIATRTEAEDPAIVERISDADVIFLSGGDQLKLTGLLGGSAVLSQIKRLYKRGTVIAGTSAGAAAASQLMIFGGGEVKPVAKGQQSIWDEDEISRNPETLPPEILRTKDLPQMTIGLDFVSRVAFDTHFDPRNRLTRLFNAVLTNPMITGIGLDEDTAVVMHDAHTIEVIGSGTVTIVDKDVIDHKETPPKRLKAGQRFNLRTGKVSTL